MRIAAQLSFISSLLLATTLAHANEQELIQPTIPPSTITASPDLRYAKALHPRQAGGYEACTWWSNAIQQCSQAGYTQVGGFSGLPFCACYLDQRYDPNNVDSLIQQCYNYARTNAELLSFMAPFQGMCRSAGDIRAVYSSGYTACSYASSVHGYCDGEGYNDASGPSKLAVCGCYSTGVWAPNLLDGLYSSCFDWAQSAGSTSFASQVWPLVGYCSSQGDVRQIMTEGNSRCQAIGSVLRSCSAEDRRFDTGDSIDNASCFCYDQFTTFIGSSRDRSAGACYTYATEYWPEYANSLSAFQGLCSRAGDVRRLYPDNDGSGNGGGNRDDDDDDASPGSSTTVPQSTGGPNGSEDAASQFEISLIRIMVLVTVSASIIHLL